MRQSYYKFLLNLLFFTASVESCLPRVCTKKDIRCGRYCGLNICKDEDIFRCMVCESEDRNQKCTTAATCDEEYSVVLRALKTPPPLHPNTTENMCVLVKFGKGEHLLPDYYNKYVFGCAVLDAHFERSANFTECYKCTSDMCNINIHNRNFIGCYP